MGAGNEVEARTETVPVRLERRAAAGQGGHIGGKGDRLHDGRHRGLRVARKHLGWYSRGLPDSAEFRVAVNREDDPKRVEDRLHALYASSIARAAA